MSYTPCHVEQEDARHYRIVRSLLEAAKDAAEWIRMQHGATPTNLDHIDEWHRTADRLEAAVRTAEGW